MMGGEDELFAWHVARQLRIDLPGNSHRVITPGWTYRVDDLAEMRKHNFVCWEKPIDALVNSRGMTICRVRLRGKIAHDKRGGIVGTELTVLWLGAWGRLLERFMCDLADVELQHLRESGYEIDPFLDNRITQKRRAIVDASLRGEYWGQDWGQHQESSKAEAAALIPLPFPARFIVREAIWPYFVGQPYRGDHSARWMIKGTLRDAQRRVPDIDTRVSQLLTEALGGINPLG